MKFEVSLVANFNQWSLGSLLQDKFSLGLPKKNILVVDDDGLTASSLASALEPFGYKADYVEDVESLQNYLEEQTPDVVLIDYIIPKKRGDELIKEMRQTGQFEDTLFILMSASVEAEPRARDLEVVFLEKPFAIDEVNRVINQSFSDEDSHTDFKELLFGKID